MVNRDPDHGYAAAPRTVCLRRAILAASLLAALLPQSHLGAAERRPGSIQLSDGTRREGELRFANGEVRVYEGDGVRKGRYLRVAQEELVKIEFRVKERSMERPWRFKEAGSDEKEYLPGTYPLLNLEATLTLKTGKPLTGHLLNLPVHLRAPDGPNPMDFKEEKFHLRQQIKGEIGQRFEDLSYVQEIRFVDAPPAGEAPANAVLQGRLKGLGRLEQAAAYGIQRARAYPGTVDAQAGTFRIADLPQDRYDLAVLTERGLWAGFSDSGARAEGQPRPLEPGDREELARVVTGFRDFFDEQQVLGVKGHREAAKVLVLQIRKAPIHGEAALEGRQLRRLDIWRFRLRKTEWQIEEAGRANLFRYSDPAQGPSRALGWIPELGGLEVDPAAKACVEIEYTGAASAVAPVPAPNGGSAP